MGLYYIYLLWIDLDHSKQIDNLMKDILDMSESILYYFEFDWIRLFNWMIIT